MSNTTEKLIEALQIIVEDNGKEQAIEKIERIKNPPKEKPPAKEQGH